MSIFAVAGLAVAQAFAQPCPNTCGDLDGDGLVGFGDFEAYAACMGASPADPNCGCADLDGSGAVDIADLALFMPVFGAFSDETPPGCTGAVGVLADLTAHRPQFRGGYAPFQRTAVAEADEASPLRGPGIRRNVPADVDPGGEDDLIEVRVTVDPPGAAVALRRSDDALRVWTTRTKAAGSGIAFDAGRTGPLPIASGQVQLTVWVEWAAARHGAATLAVEPLAGGVAKDVLAFHTFAGLVLALGGEDQVPSDPPDPQVGTFVVAKQLYAAGYDVLMFDEDHVAADGSGAVYDEAATAIRERGVQELAIYGYSHGAGSTYHLSDRLDVNRAGLGMFEIRFTSYVDAVRNNSDIDVAMELRRPPGSFYHLNHYQVGSLFQDFNLDGGPVPDSHPPPEGLNVETTPWGANATHFTVDDYDEVKTPIDVELRARTQP